MTDTDAMKLLQDLADQSQYTAGKMVDLTNKVAQLNYNMEQFSHYALWTEALSGAALVCAVIALLATRRTIKLLNETPPPMPRVVRTVPLPPMEQYERPCGEVLGAYGKAPNKLDDDILSNLARELDRGTNDTERAGERVD